MNRLKSYFMLMLPMALMGIFITAIYHLFAHRQFPLVWFFVLLTVSPLLFFFLLYMVFRSQPRTSRWLPMQTLLSLVGLLGTIYVTRVHPVLSARENTLALSMAMAGFLLHFLYVFWYSRLNRPASTPLEVGKKLPQFMVEDEMGRLNTASFLGSPTIFIFYRGNWCPFCVAQIKELAQNYRILAKSGVKIVLISPQPEKLTQALAKRFDVPFIFVTDKGNRLARQLNLLHEHGLPKGLELMGYDSDTVFPTVVVTDTQGIVLFIDETDNYRNRPDPRKYLRFLAGRPQAQSQENLRANETAGDFQPDQAVTP